MLPGEKVFELFIFQWDFPERYQDQLIKIKSIYQIFERVISDLQSENEKSNGHRIVEWFEWIKIVYGLYNLTIKQAKNSTMENQNSTKDIDHYYVAIISEDPPFYEMKNLSEEEIDRKRINLKKLGFWCFNPGLGFSRLNNLKPLSIILTSGTLSPLSTFATELKVEFPIKLECSHVINKEQYNISILTKGIDGNHLNFTFKERNNERILADLGRTLINIWSVSPGGMLWFFTSYSFMNQTIKMWKRSGIFQQLSREKPIYCEPTSAKKCKSVIKGFFRDVFEKGAILMAVWRGKISEGVDFSDDAAKTVVQVGIPFPMMKDPRTIMKKQYLDKLREQEGQKQGLTGSSWYTLQATRAYNQAIGRAIRHKDDYGNIILIDERFSQDKYKWYISKWLRNSVKVFGSYDELETDTATFFENVQKLKLKPNITSFDQVFENDNEIEEEIINEDSSLRRNSDEGSKRFEEYIEDPNSSTSTSIPKVDISILSNSSFKRKKVVRPKESYSEYKFKMVS
jgi:hypothetical protein